MIQSKVPSFHESALIDSVRIQNLLLLLLRKLSLHGFLQSSLLEMLLSFKTLPSLHQLLRVNLYTSSQHTVRIRSSCGQFSCFSILFKLVMALTKNPMINRLTRSLLLPCLRASIIIKSLILSPSDVILWLVMTLNRWSNCVKLICFSLWGLLPNRAKRSCFPRATHHSFSRLRFRLWLLSAMKPALWLSSLRSLQSRFLASTHGLNS